MLTTGTWLDSKKQCFYEDRKQTEVDGGSSDMITFIELSERGSRGGRKLEPPAPPLGIYSRAPSRHAKPWQPRAPLH